MFSDRRYQEITGICIILLGAILLLSIFSFSISDFDLLAEGKPVNNIIGPVGAWLGNFLRTAFGYSSFLFPCIPVLCGWLIIRKGDSTDAMERIFALSFLLITSSAFIALMRSESIPHYAGGLIGLYLSQFLIQFLGAVGAYLIVVILNIVGLILLGALSISSMLASAGDGRLRSFAIRAYTRMRSRRKDGEVPLSSIPDELRRKEKKPPWIERKRVRIINGHAFPMDENIDARDYISLLEYHETPQLHPVTEDREHIDMTHHEFPGEAAAGAAQEIPLYTVEEPEAEDISGMETPASDADSPEADAAGPEETEEARATITQNSFALPGESDAHARAADAIILERNTGELSGALKEHLRGMEDEMPTSRKKETAVREVQQTFDFGISDGDDPRKVFEEIPINRDYIIPTAFLQSSSTVDIESWKSEIIKNSELLVTTLNEFGIESRVVNVNRGPVLTLYEMQIAPGIKVNRIVGLSDDIAMALAGSRVRIVAPIPGKSAIGVEVPNKKREMVMLGDIINSKEYQSQSGHLKVGLGKDILGKPVTLDLKKLPHLLIAGATGSGKSVCVNSIITSLIYNYDPNYVRFILVDPKMVELQSYNGIPHLLTPVIVEPGVAPKALKWAMYEMERRYRLLSELNTRDIERYNQKINGYGNSYERLPYIVIIMDELADLMMVASKEIEGFITRIAQKARAVGIHLVLATQRPSVDVITGIIKANFPARIAFQVAQKTDSRTIIDQNGAEKLLGKGDMLYQSPMSSFPARIQGAYISEDEIFTIVHHLRSMGNPSYIDIDESIFEEDLDGDDGDDDDELFVEALRIVEETKKASASYLQRRLSIGYNRAARIIELMEERGYVGSQQGSKPREVFI